MLMTYDSSTRATAAAVRNGVSNRVRILSHYTITYTHFPLVSLISFQFNFVYFTLNCAAIASKDKQTKQVVCVCQ